MFKINYHHASVEQVFRRIIMYILEIIMYTRALNYDSITSNDALICQVVVTGNNTVLQKSFHFQ